MLFTTLDKGGTVVDLTVKLSKQIEDLMLKPRNKKNIETMIKKHNQNNWGLTPKEQKIENQKILDRNMSGKIISIYQLDKNFVFVVTYRETNKNKKSLIYVFTEQEGSLL